MNHTAFADRSEAGWMLVERLRGETFHDPLVLAIPRGGVEVGVALARGLGAELDVVLEAGESIQVDVTEAERKSQMVEITRRREMFRGVRPQATIAGRTVILTDDGIATGATMIAALHTVRAAGAREIIVAVPVGSPERVDAIRRRCDRVICLLEPQAFWAVGQFYRNFDQVEDSRVVELLREHCLPIATPQPS